MMDNTISNPNLTILIQGRVLKETLQFYIENYSRYSVIISTWDDMDDLSFLSDHKNITLLQNKKPSHAGFQNINLQIESTLHGLKLATTQYCIKMRGDEYFSNIDYIFKQMLLKPSKIHTSPIWFRKCSYIPYHMSDHLICGKTSNLRLMFHTAKIRREYYAEPRLTKAYLSNFIDAKNLIDSNCKKYMTQYFKILDLTKLQPYRLTANIWSSIFYDNFIPEGGQSISKIEDI